MTFKASHYRKLEVLIRTDGINKTVSVDGVSRSTGVLQFCHFVFDLAEQSEHTLLLPDDFIGLCYLSGSDDILSRGITFIDSDGKLYSCETLAGKYDTPYREQFHFAAFAGWMNDPNGLCFFNGYYHLFYQANPFGQQWDTMFWGHAVSRDLVHWTHLPFVFFPQPELSFDKSYVGGAFSGSAVVYNGLMHIFLTRHFAEQSSNDTPFEYQNTAVSSDGVSVAGEHSVIPVFPARASHNFRDPKVEYINGQWHMVLGSCYDGVPSVLLYTSPDLENWTFCGRLFSDTEQDGNTVECPDFFQLDGAYVLSYSLQPRQAVSRKFIRMRYCIGSFDGTSLESACSGICDFGPDYYAAQSFSRDGRRVVIGWLNDYYLEHITVPGGVNGSMSLPRELHIKNNKLYQIPVKEIQTLVGDVYQLSEDDGCLHCTVPGSSARIRCTLSQSTDFVIDLGRGVSLDESETGISFICENGCACLQTQGLPSSSHAFIAPVAEIHSFEIYIDRRSVEVFINDGEAVGTKLFYRSGKDSVITARFENRDAVTTFEIAAMRSIWQ